MNTQTRSKSMEKTILFFFILFAVLVLSSCTSGDQADSSSCPIGTSVSIDVTDARPREVFDQLSDQLNCKITYYPFFTRTITVHMQNVRASDVIVTVCQQLDAKYIYNVGGRLSIMPLTAREKSRAHYWEERNRILQSRLPEGMTFEDVPLSSVLEEISMVSGLNIKPWKEEGDRKVTIDVSGMTVDEALKAVVLHVDGEGAVLIEQTYLLHHSWGQYWLWGNPPSF